MESFNLFLHKLLTILLCYFFAVVGGILFEIPNGLKLPSFGFSTQYIFHPWFTSIKVPSFLGILIAGVVLNNLPNDPLIYLDKDWVNYIRLIALITIIYRIGLGLDISAISKKFRSILVLALFPNLIESIFCAFLSMLFFHLSPIFGFSLGFIAAGASTAVLVPVLVNLQEGQYGIEKGIPSILLASSAIDNICSIILYNLVSTIGLGGISILNEETTFLILKAVLGIILGCLFGLVFGMIGSYLGQLHSKPIFLISLLFSYFLVFFLNNYGFRGAGFISVLLFNLISSNYWPIKKKQKVSKLARKIWDVLRYFLFVLIGTSIKLNELDAHVIGYSFIIVIICTIIRMICCFLSFPESDLLTLKERFYAAFVWISKASLQAALGSAIYYEAKIHDLRPEIVKQGMIISYVCVVYIVITAPFGAILMAWYGPKWLKKYHHHEEKELEEQKENAIRVQELNDTRGE